MMALEVLEHFCDLHSCESLEPFKSSSLPHPPASSYSLHVLQIHWLIFACVFANCIVALFIKFITNFINTLSAHTRCILTWQSTSAFLASTTILSLRKLRFVSRLSRRHASQWFVMTIHWNFLVLYLILCSSSLKMLSAHCNVIFTKKKSTSIRPRKTMKKCSS